MTVGEFKCGPEALKVSDDTEMRLYVRDVPGNPLIPIEQLSTVSFDSPKDRTMYLLVEAE